LDRFRARSASDGSSVVALGEVASSTRTNQGAPP
jgi:hypothetical protein